MDSIKSAELMNPEELSEKGGKPVGEKTKFKLKVYDYVTYGNVIAIYMVHACATMPTTFLG